MTSDEVGTGMSGSEPNTTIPEDELRAALAEIEKMSGEKAVAIPSLDNGREEAEARGAGQSASEPPRSTPDRAGTPSEGGDHISQNKAEVRASAAGGTSPAKAPAGEATSAASEPDAEARTAEAGTASNSRDSRGDEPLQPAMPEVETVSPSQHGTPSRRRVVQSDDSGELRAGDTPEKPPAAEAPGDDSPDGEASAGPAQPCGTGVPPVVCPDQEASAGPAQPCGTGVPPVVCPDQEASAGPAQAKRKKLRLRIGKKSADGDVTENPPPEKPGSTEAVGGVAEPVAPLARRVCQLVDQGLDAINQPFRRLGEAGRVLVGWVALVTLVLSILAMVLMPILFPHRNAITFLQEKRAQLDAPPPAEAPESPEVDD